MIPDPLVQAHLAVIGRYCPGWRGHQHPADDLTARSGRVLCGQCSDALVAWLEAPAAGETSGPTTRSREDLAHG